MRLQMLFLTTMMSASLISGCATVNMSEMATPKTVKSEAEPEKNIVLRAASKLYTMITNKGISAKDTGQRVQSAASILLNGLEERDVTVSDINYVEQGLPLSVIEADIAYTAQHVSQTTKAAEVFLEVSDTDRNMREELKSLETALLAAREASTVFSTAVNADNESYIRLQRELTALTRVTDRFGERVRLNAAAEMAARRAEENS